MNQKFKITSKIEITKSGRHRVGKMETQLKKQVSNALYRKFIFTVTGDSIQDVIGKIERKFNVAIGPNDITYNFRLRKDEILPTVTDTNEDEICAVKGCLLPTIGKIGDVFFCDIHLRAAVKTRPVEHKNKQYRNSVCGCGSGKKYKNCCATKRRSAQHYYNSIYDSNKPM